MSFTFHPSIYQPVYFSVWQQLQRCGRRDYVLYCQAGSWKLAVLLGQCKKHGFVWCCARIGHTHLIYSYILNRDLPPQCEHCQCILTVHHNLVESSHLVETSRYLIQDIIRPSA